MGMVLLLKRAVFSLNRSKPPPVHVKERLEGVDRLLEGNREQVAADEDDHHGAKEEGIDLEPVYVEFKLATDDSDD
jgi:hypothetical protein